MGLYNVECTNCKHVYQWFSGNAQQVCPNCGYSTLQPVNNSGQPISTTPKQPKAAKFIALDDETGGVGEDVSLLTVYFAILDEDLNLIDELDLTLKPNDGLYKIEPESLTINNINLVEHDKAAEPYSSGGQKLVSLLKKHSKGGKDSLIPIGHNVTFDINKVCSNLLGRKTWNQYVSYRIQDTQVIGRFFQIAGLYQAEESMSLFNQAKLWDISIPGVEHTSKYDTLLTVELYKKQIDALKKLHKYAYPWAGELDEQS